MAWLRYLLILGIASFALAVPVAAQRQFGFDNRQSSGQPYLSPEETVKRMKVPPGWEVKLVAGEPDVVNPIAFTIDEKGRIWVLECFEYPKRTPKGKKPRDRIKIIEEDPHGGPPKVTVWADGQTLPIGWDLASGLEVGHGGAFLGAPPYLFFLQDKDGDGKCDHQEILLKGFGSQDTHETLNTFQWGPDSRLYGLHGVFTQSEIDGVKLNAAVWRYDAPKKNFEIFAEGTSNPWGMDFDSKGQCLLACCVIPHLFHMVPGGVYKRQGGITFNPYSYGLINEICDHEHHKESGWAHAGLLVLEGEHVPEAYRGSVIMGSIHGCSIKRDTLRPNGSTFVASCAPDFLTSGDKNFRPINLRWGPDGSIYLIDWHDQNPCHQALPDSWDYTRGRIYKIQRTGAKAASPVDLSKSTTKELISHLKNPNPWWHRTALRLLNERKDKGAISPLREMAIGSKVEEHALRGLWGLYAVGGFDSTTASMALKHPSPSIRSWAIRLIGEGAKVDYRNLDYMTQLAKTDPSPEVRLQLASTAARIGRPGVEVLHYLMTRVEDAKDPCIPLMIWLALEPQIRSQRDTLLAWLLSHTSGNPLVMTEILPRTVRRLVAANKVDDLTVCLGFVGGLKESAVRKPALEGLLTALKASQLEPPSNWEHVKTLLEADVDSEVRQLTHRVALHFRDRIAIARALKQIQDASVSVSERLEAVQDLAHIHPPDAAKVFLSLTAGDPDLEIRVEACRALANYEAPEISQKLLSQWKQHPPKIRNEAVNVLAGRKTWAQDLLAAVGKGAVPRTDLNDNTILRIRAFKDGRLTKQIETVWGRFRETPAELEKLIFKMRGHLYDGRASFERGKVVFDNQCAKCHKFDGRGHDVGPNLDGAARDIDYLLANILDPNRVVGQPYYLRTVELISGRIETGLLHAEDDQSITLKLENNVQKVIPRKEIEGKVLIQEKSVMPEGLANNMTVQDFRDLVRYMMAHPFLTDVEIVGTKVPEVGPAGRIPLPPMKTEGKIQLRAVVHAPSSMRSRLLLGSNHSVEVRVDDKMIYRGQPGKSELAPDQHGVDLILHEGPNRLLFEITYRGDNEGLYARFWDPDRKLKYTESRGAP